MRITAFFLMGFLFLSACDIINPEEDIPSYIYLNEPTLSSTPREGSASQNISEYWVFLDDEFIGAFPIPSTIPVLKVGTAELRVEAGIRENGLSSTPDIYPFYTPYRQSIELKTGETQEARPQFAYRDNTQFAFIDNFDQNFTLFRDVITGTSQSRMRISENDPFEGNSSGLIQLTSTDPFVEIATATRFGGLLDNGNSVFIEVNYRSEVPVSFGILGYEQGGSDPVVFAYQAGFNASEEWKKIYFNFTSIIFNSEADEFKIVMQAALPLDANNNFALDQAQVFLDNIKLVHF